MKSCHFILYLSIIVFNKVIYAMKIDDKDLTKLSVVKNITNIDLSDISEHLIKGLHHLSKFQCPSENTDCEDTHLTFPELVKKYGYSVEEHEVETCDGYLLTMFRMPNKGPAVLLLHGGASSCYDFVTIGPQAGLAYQLADAGYDVWLANCRGTKYSTRHVSLSTDSAEFWDFSWNEIGLYDTTAMIDYIINATNVKDVKVIAYSQGTNAVLTLCSEMPEYNDKISIIVLFSPNPFVGHSKSPVFQLISGPIYPDFYQLGKLIGVYSLNAQMDIGPIVDLLKKTLCATPETASAICHNLLFIVYGSDYEQVNKTSLPVIYSHFPDSTSTKLLQHYIQIRKSGEFRQYDYGEHSNSIKYGSKDPPEYSLDKVETKVAVCWSHNDLLYSEEDLQMLFDRLPNIIDVYKVPHENFNHIDYIFARDVKSLLYDKVLELLKSN